MRIVPPPARPGNSAASQSHPERVAAAHRRHHEAQVGLSCGEANSMAADQAAEAYRDSVADAQAANFGKLQEFVASLRMLAEDETGLRQLAGRYLNVITGGVPAGTLNVLDDLIRAVAAVRKQVAAQGIDLVAIDGNAGVRFGRIEAALAAAGIEVKS